jgi:molybdopterin converting factor small subunit
MGASFRSLFGYKNKKRGQGGLMAITVKLFATFRVGRGKIVEMDYVPGMTAQTVIDSLGITAPEIAALIVDGVDGKVENMLKVAIKEDGYLAIFPPVAGG